MPNLLARLPLPPGLRRGLPVGGARPGLVLELDLSEPPLTGDPGDPVAAVRARRRVTVRDVVEGLARGAEDPDVVGVLARLGATMGLATAQDVREAVTAFRRSGKPAVAWADTFGEMAPGTIPYYVATAFDTVVLQPSGDVVLTGVSADAFFLRDALGAVGLQVQVGQRHEYKNAANSFTETGFTDAHREATEGLVRSVVDQLAAGLAERPAVTAESARALVGAGPVLGQDAVGAGLVDLLGYRDQALEEVRRQVSAAGGGRPVELRYVNRYRRSPVDGLRRTTLERRDPAVAVVTVQGTIHRGRRHRSLVRGPSAGADTVSASLRAAGRDERVRAVVLRVDSPGGSYVASDTIWREIQLVRSAGKPVVVSMGDVAASGGYFLAMGADVVVAQPGTLTGSIGVFGGKLVQSGLVERLRVSHDAVREGSAAGMFSPYEPFDEASWSLVNRWLDRVYDDFTAKVAQGRGLSRERVHEIARGRVWTGEQAREVGLVDELGGLSHAVGVARRRAGLSAAAPVIDLPGTSPFGGLRTPQSSEHNVAAGVARSVTGTAVRSVVAHAAARAGSGLSDVAVATALDQLRSETWGPVAEAATALALPAGGPLLLPGTPRIS